MKGFIGKTAFALAGIMGAMPGVMPSLKHRRSVNDRRKMSYTPPRSMTPAEKEYYAIHKNLHHFREAI